MRSILALDFATKTGWAFRGKSGELSSGVWDLSIKKDESSGMRLIRFESKLQLFLPLVEVIAFESVSAGRGPRANFDSVKLQSKLQAMIERLAEKTPGVECVGYNLKSMKAHALPKGVKQNKEEMVKAAKKKWPDVEIMDDNQADALWLLDLAWGEINGPKS